MENGSGGRFDHQHIAQNPIGEEILGGELQSNEMERDIFSNVDLDLSFRDQLIVLSNPDSEYDDVMRAMEQLLLGTMRSHDNVVGPLSHLFREAGLYPRNNRNDIQYGYRKLKGNGFPVVSRTLRVKNKGKEMDLTYYFYWKGREVESISFLNRTRDERFEAMRVPTVVTLGPKEDEVITTSDLNDKERFTMALNTISDFVDNPGKISQVGYRNVNELVGEKPPVRVYVTSSGIFVRREDQEKLRRYLIRRIFNTK